MTALLSDYLAEGRSIRPAAKHGQTAQIGIVLRELVVAGHITQERMIDQIWGQDEDGGPQWAEKAVMGLIYDLRRRLHPKWKIKCLGHSGYQLVKEDV